MSMTYEEAISKLKYLKHCAETVDAYEDDTIADYRCMAESNMREIIDILLSLKLLNEHDEATHNRIPIQKGKAESTKHYVAMFDWATDGNSGNEILGVGHTPKEAKSLLSQRLVQEIMFAEEHNYKIETNNTEFEAYEDGFYASEHTHLWIEEVVNGEEQNDA